MNAERVKVVYDYDVTSAKRNEELYGRFSKGLLIFGLASQTTMIVKKKKQQTCAFFCTFPSGLESCADKIAYTFFAILEKLSFGLVRL